MGYRLLGFVVWKGLKFFLRRRYGHLVPSRRTAAAAGVAALAIAGLIVVQRREGG
jgi:hypothetical protein